MRHVLSKSSPMQQRTAVISRQLIWLPLLLALSCVACKPRHKIPPAPQPIHGYVYASVNADIAGAVAIKVSSIAIPDIEVVAKNVASGVNSAPTHTDPYGYFRTPAVPAGSYQICVSGTGFASTCDPQVLVITNRVKVLDHNITIRTKQHAVLGSVHLSDKTTPCFWYNPAFDANVVMTAKVALEDSAGNLVSGPIRGNNFGEYVLPTGAAPGAYKVTVACEATQAAAAVTLTAASLKQDFILNNGAPHAHLLEAAMAGVGVRRASPGDALTIKVPASDPDNNALHYQWIDESAQVASFPDAATVNWTAPAAPGLQVLHVQVSDGRGGYAVGRTVINVGPNEMIFSGTAVNRETHVPVAMVNVNLNGVAVNTDSNGRFQLKVPDAARFVLNANKTGFALTSRILYSRAVEVEVPMDPVQTSVVDGGKGGTVGVKVTGCTPKGKGDGKTPPPTTTYVGRECVKQEIGTLKFAFEPNSLMSGDTPYAGVVTVESLQFDLTLPNAIPGDQSATYKGKDTRLETFGAFHIKPLDAAGNPLTMATGKTVDVSMPIHPLALATAPAKIPFFSYDESTGFWVEHGELKRVGNNYVGKITHFSEFNADTIGGSAACVKIELDSNFPSTVRFNATYTDPAVGNFNHPDGVITDTVSPIVIERMVPNKDFTLVIDDNSAAHNVLQSVAINTGSATTSTFPVPPPYTACSGPFIIHYNALPTPSEHFLIPATTVDNSANYKSLTTNNPPDYPGRDTLDSWKSQNGFPASGNAADETHAVYFNNGDLKFGRGMHCRVTGATSAGNAIACYVSNFGLVGVDFSAQPTVLTAAYANTPIAATVAMEYHPDRTDRVQFWAYHGDATGTYFPNPALDSEGNKPMPDICMACHQGSYGGAGTLANASIFLPFDIDSFIGDDGNPLQTTLGTGAPRPTHADFRQLNQWVLQASQVDASGVSTSVQELMNIWYVNAAHPTGVNDAAATYHFNQGAAALNTPPTGTAGEFATNQALYDNVVRPVCRTCHIARTPGYDTWDQLSQLTGSAPTIRNRVCGPATTFPHFTMPHAEVPFKRFWKDSLSTTLGSELPPASTDCSN